MAMGEQEKLSEYALALHTTSPQLGLSLSDFQGEEKTQTWDLGRDLATHLHVLLQEFISPYSWSELKWVAVAKGPGSFTGTRIGVATARTLAQQLDIPLFAISTLASIADSEKKQHQFPDQDLIAVQLPARRQQYFVAIYEVSTNGFVSHLRDQVMTDRDWEMTLNQISQPYHLVNPLEETLGKTVSSVLSLAAQQWHIGKRPKIEDAKPFYGEFGKD